jgi:G patch domain-containing protein 1
VLHPKQDLHGLGYDPFKHAPEFRGTLFCTTNSYHCFSFISTCLHLIPLIDRKKFERSRDRGHKRNDISARGSLLISNCKI